MQGKTFSTRRTFLRMSVIGFASAAILAACSPASPVSPTAAPAAVEPTKPAAAPAATTPTEAPKAAAAAPASTPVTIKFNNRTGKELDIFTAMAKKFNEAHPNITVKMESFSGANQEYFQKMAVLISGGTEGDLVWMSSIEGFYDYASRNVWLPINDLAARDKIDMSQWYKAAGDMMSVGGKLYGLPLWSHPSVVGLFYNQDILDKAGVKLPDDLNFDKLTEIAKQLTKRTSDGKAEQFGYNPGRGYYNGHGQVILAYGGDMVSKDGKKMTYGEPAVKQALTWMYDMDHTHKVTPLPGEADTGQLTINGKLAIWANGVWGYWGASQWKFNWGAALTPKGPGGTHGSMLQTDANPISKRSKNVDPAWEFHKFMSGKDAGMILLDNDYVASSRPDIYNSPTAQGKKGLAPFAKALEEAAALPVPANYRLRELEISINQVMDNLWLGKMTVDQVTAEVNRAGQQVLDKAGAST